MKSYNNNGVRFDAGAHTYTRECDGKRLQGVTKMIQEMLYPNEFDCIDEKVLKAKAEYGTQRHNEIQYMIVFGDEPTTTDQLRFSRLMEQASLNVTASEYTVTDGAEFASNIDVVAERDGEVVLIDIKTCASLNREKVSWQLSFYADWFEHCNPSLHVSAIYACWLPKVGREKMVEVPRKAHEDLVALSTAWLNGEPYEFASKIDRSLLSRIQEVKIAMNALDEEYKELTESLIADMKAVGETSYKDEFVSVSLRAESTTQRFDSKAFKEACPEQYAMYVKESSTPPSVTVKIY